jgi:hypothetical protein
MMELCPPAPLQRPAMRRSDGLASLDSRAPKEVPTQPCHPQSPPGRSHLPSSQRRESIIARSMRAYPDPSVSPFGGHTWAQVWRSPPPAFPQIRQSGWMQITLDCCWTQSNCCAADSLLPASPDPEDQIAGLCLVGPTPVGPRSKEHDKQF